MHVTCWTIRLWVSRRKELSGARGPVRDWPQRTGFIINSTRLSLTWSPSHIEKWETRIFYKRLTQDQRGSNPECMYDLRGSQALYQCATSPVSGKTYFALLLGGHHSISRWEAGLFKLYVTSCLQHFIYFTILPQAKYLCHFFTYFFCLLLES